MEYIRNTIRLKGRKNLIKNFILFVLSSVSLSDTLQLQLQELSDVLIKFYQPAGLVQSWRGRDLMSSTVYKDIYIKSLHGKLVVGESQRGTWTYQMSTVIYWTGKYFHLNFEIYFSLHKYFCSYWSQVFTPLSNLFWSLLLQVINLRIIKEIKLGSNCIHSTTAPLKLRQ